MSKPTKIILDKQSDLILTNAKIVGATGIVKSDLPGLVSDLANLDTAIQTEATDRSVAIQTEAAARAAEIATERLRINAILEGSDVNLNQFREVVAFVQSIDLANDTDLLAKVTEINGKITAEETARIAGDAALTADLATLQSYVDTTVNDAIAQLSSDLADLQSYVDTTVDSAITSLTADLADETAARIADVDTEEARAIAAEATLQAAIDAEAAARIAADSTLDGKIADIISNTNAPIIDSFTEVVDNLNAEIARAEAAEADLDATLRAIIVEEHAHHTAAEATLQAAIDAEAAARIAADETLDGKIADIISNTNAPIIDSFTEVVDSLNAEIARAEAAEAAEETARIAGDTQLSTDLTAEIARAEAAEASLDAAKLDLAGGTMTGAIDMGGNNVSGANTVNTTSLDTGNINGVGDGPISVNEDLFFNDKTIKNLPAPTNGGDAANKTYVDNAIVSANGDLSNETTLRIAGDAYLQSEIDLLPLTDGDTIEVDLVNSYVRLKEVVAAPDSGVRTFEGDIKVGAQPDTLTGSYNELSLITKGILDNKVSQEVSTINNSISEEVSRAQNAEGVLQSNIDNQKVRIDAILEAAGSETDNFVEIVALINSVDTTNDEAFASYVLSNNQRLTIEEQERLSLTNLLGDGLVNEQIAREDGDAVLQHEFDVLPTTDGETIEVNPVDNTIRLKDVIDAPDTGYRVFRGDVKAQAQPETNETFNELSFVTKGWVDEKVGTNLTDAINAEEDARTQADAALDAAKLNLAGGTMTGTIDMGNSPIVNADYVVARFVEIDEITTTSVDQKVKLGSNLELLYGNTIINLPAPNNDGDVANKLYVDGEVATALPLAGGTMTGAINMGGSNNINNVYDLSAEFINAKILYSTHDGRIRLDSNLDAGEFKRVINLPAPINGGDATNKTYVDAIIDSTNSTLTADLADETAARIADVDAEEARAIAAESALSSDLTDLQSYVDTTVDSAIATLTSDLSDETSARIADVDAEETRAIAAELKLQSNIDYETSRIDAILIGASASADNFAEIVALINSVDTTNDQVFAGYVLSNDAALAAEESSRIAGDVALSATFSAAMTAEVAARIAGDAQLSSDLADLQSYVDTTVDSAITTLTSDLANETEARIADVDAEEVRALAAELVLTNNLSFEEAARITADAALSATFSAAISFEEARAIAAELVLTNNLSFEEAARITADAALSATFSAAISFEEAARITAVAAEEARAISVETAMSATFSAAISFEEARAIAAELVLTNNLSSEEAARIAADAALSATLQSNIDEQAAKITAILEGSTVDLNQFAEVVAFVQSIDMTNDQSLLSVYATFSAAMSAEEAARIADVDAEEARAIAAEGVLTSALSSEESSRIAADAVLSATFSAALSTETVARITAISSEESSRIAGDAALSATFSAAIYFEESSRIAGDAALSATFSAAMTTETARAIAAELVLTTDFANIYCKKVSVTGTPNGVLTTFTLALPVRIGSEMISINGLLMEEGEDYTTIVTSGKVSGVEFLYAPSTEMKVRAYGVCGL